MPDDVVSLQRYLEAQIAALNDRLTAAQAEIDRRLRDMNELRDIVTVTQTQLLPRSEFEMSHRDLVSSVHQAREELAASQGASRTWGIVAVVASSLIAAVVSYIK